MLRLSPFFAQNFLKAKMSQRQQSIAHANLVPWEEMNYVGSDLVLDEDKGETGM